VAGPQGLDHGLGELRRVPHGGSGYPCCDLVSNRIRSGSQSSRAGTARSHPSSPSSVLLSSKACSTAQRTPLSQTKVRRGVLTGA
jgi:hypothetical protein